MRHFIDSVLEPAVWVAADWSLRWAALLAVVVLVLWIFRPRQAAIRQLILFVALGAGLLIPCSPRWGDGWKHTRRVDGPSASLSFPRSAWERTSGRSAFRTARVEDATRSVAAVRSHAERGNEEEEPIVEPQASETSEPLGRHRLILLIVASCWSLAVGYLLVRRLCGWLCLRRLRRESIVVTGASADVFANCRAELRVRSTVRLAVHSQIHSPILFGSWHPRILVPSDWPQRSIASQRAALLHELAHVRRRDHLFAPLLEIVRIAFFFHPLVRWLLARLEYERELLCDEMVVRLGVDRRDYARLLLEFARSSGRLEWPAVSLPMSRRRTVKGRIYHLLEEDMERWIRPLSFRWAVVVGSGLLTLSLGVASYRVWAQEKDRPDNPTRRAEPRPSPSQPESEAIKREDLLYGGKDFYRWRRDILTELKGSIRVDGIRAFAAFGANGYAAEATQTILDLMRGYDTMQNNPSDDDAAVVKAGYQAVTKIGAAALPALAQAVEGKNRNARLFAIEALRLFGSDASSAVPSLLKAMKNEDFVTALQALVAVGSIDSRADGYVSALIGALKNKDYKLRYHAAMRLRDTGTVEDAKPAIPALLDALRDKYMQVRWDAIQTLNVIGAEKRGVGAVIPLLREKDYNIRNQALDYLANLGPDAKEAVPALIEILKETENGWRRPIDALAEVGPAAKDAIPELTKLLRSTNGQTRDAAIQALRKISPDYERRNSR